MNTTQGEQVSTETTHLVLFGGSDDQVVVIPMATEIWNAPLTPQVFQGMTGEEAVIQATSNLQLLSGGFYAAAGLNTVDFDPNLLSPEEKRILVDAGVEDEGPYGWVVVRGNGISEAVEDEVDRQLASEMRRA